MTVHAIALPGPPVTRSVTWEQVRAYLIAEGWSLHIVTGMERWTHPAHANESVWTGDGHRLTDAVTWVARLASVSPGEMLARIADGPPCVTCQTWRTTSNNVAILDYRNADAHSAAFAYPSGAWSTFDRYGNETGRGRTPDIEEAKRAAVANITKPSALSLPPTASPLPDLWALVIERVGHHIKYMADVENKARGGGVVRSIAWRRLYPGGIPSDYREATGDSEEACLRAVLAYEDAADAKEGRT